MSMKTATKFNNTIEIGSVTSSLRSILNEIDSTPMFGSNKLQESVKFFITRYKGSKYKIKMQ